MKITKEHLIKLDQTLIRLEVDNLNSEDLSIALRQLNIVKGEKNEKFTQFMKDNFSLDSMITKIVDYIELQR